MADHMGGETFIPAAGPVGYQRLLTRHVHPSEGRIRGTRVPARWSEADLSMRLHAPRLGEHSFEVLLEAGLSQRQIDELVAAGVTLASPDAQEREARQ